MSRPLTGSPGRAWLMLAVLLLVYTLAHVDRQLLNLLVEPIKRDLNLSDVEISLLQGFTFALFLAIAAFPIARLIDTRRRTVVLAAAIATWSIATAACGYVGSFTGLLVARIVVAIAEAAVIPATYSLVGDLFARSRQGRAISVISLGSYAGSGLALLAGAASIGATVQLTHAMPWLQGLASWQIVFVIVGLPGLVVATSVAFLGEPARREPIHPSRNSLAEVAGWMRRHRRTVLYLNLGVAFTSMCAYSLLAWLPTLLVRNLDVSLSTAGSIVGRAVLYGGMLGALIAGVFGDALRTRFAGLGRLALVIVGLLTSLVLIPVGLRMPTPDLALAWLLPAFAALAMTASCGSAAVQEITPRNMLGVQHALASFSATTIGLGLGPTSIALLTEHGPASEQPLLQALVLACPMMLAVALAAYTLAAGSYGRSLREVAGHP